jgi:hypothetical protein
MKIERKGISCLAGVVFATLVALTLVFFFLLFKEVRVNFLSNFVSA